MSDKQRAKALFEHVRRNLLGLVQDIDADRWCWQPFETANHVLWSVGHIGVGDGLAIESLTGKKSSIPNGYDALFGPKSTPVADASKYPSQKDVMDFLAKQRQDLLRALDASDEGVLTRPMPDMWKSLWPDVGAMLFSLACHEDFHTGQIAVIRKALGLKPKFF